MRGRIGVLVHSRLDRDTFCDLFEDELDKGNMLIELFTSNNLLAQGRSLIERGAEVLMVRGGILQEFIEQLSPTPVIQMPLSANDIICALSESAGRYKRIHLLLPNSTVFDFENCKRLFPANVECFVFQSVAQARRFIESLEYSQDMAVMGGVVTTGLARRRGLNTIYTNVQRASVLAAYQNLTALMDQRRDDSRKMRLLESVLSNIDDGIIVLDFESRISHFNRRCEKIFGGRAAQMIGRKLDQCIPALATELERLKRMRQTESIFKSGGYTLSLNLVQMREDHAQTLIALKDISRLQELEKSLRYQLNKKGLTAKYTFEDILTRDERMRVLIERAKIYARNDDTILICGQSGTGKELFAQSIHNDSSRREHPFVAVNCAALSESLLESELFGYVGGAFTGARKEGKMGLFELAHRGTIFLDEINSMSPNLQSKVLRVIEEKEIMRVGSDYIVPLDVRIIAATNADLLSLVKAEAFRKDLYFRLNVLELRIPPLGARKEDILYLFRHYVCEKTGEPPEGLRIAPEMEELLLRHGWLGNIRELKNVANKYVLLHGDNSQGEILPAEEPAGAAEREERQLDLKKLNRMVEQFVIQTLMEEGKNKSEIAKLLGISRTALYKKLGAP